MINRRIRWLGFVLVACFVLLFLQLNNFQVRQAKTLVNNPDNAQNGPNLWQLPRGDIYSSDSAVLAKSVPTNDGFGELRVYPPATAALFADITGYNSVAVESATGLESEYFSELSQHNSSATTLGQLLTQHKTTDDITITVSVALQEAAATALGGRTGAVVAIDPQTGAILAMYGNPTFNPNLFAVHDVSAVDKSYNELLNSGALINYATAQARAPGSTFKVVDSSAIFDQAPKIGDQLFPLGLFDHTAGHDRSAALQLRRRVLRGQPRRGLRPLVRHSLRARRPAARRGEAVLPSNRVRFRRRPAPGPARGRGGPLEFPHASELRR